jgi:hypothetical protein
MKRLVGMTELPQEIQEVYYDHPETGEITNILERSDGFEVHFNEAYDRWTQVNKVWNYEVCYK